MKHLHGCAIGKLLFMVTCLKDYGAKLRAARAVFSRVAAARSDPSDLATSATFSAASALSFGWPIFSVDLVRRHHGAVDVKRP